MIHIVTYSDSKMINLESFINILIRNGDELSESAMTEAHKGRRPSVSYIIISLNRQSHEMYATDSLRAAR